MSSDNSMRGTANKWEKRINTFNPCRNVDNEHIIHFKICINRYTLCVVVGKHG